VNNSIIQKETFRFLQQLSRNNNRDWFNAHKTQYLKVQKNAEDFMDALISRMNTHDQLETPSGKKSLYRIYNDVRFSKDKAPYNPRFSGYLKRSKPQLRGGYYIWLKPGDSRIGCGFSYPNAENLKRVRLDISANHEEWRKLLHSRSILSNFGTMKGDQVKTSPRGFPNDHPAIDLLRFKQYWFGHSFADEEVLSNDFVNKVNKTYKGIRPFFDYMSEVLTTDLNGESIL
jgi:uncharacterized protein (TIGR02453 family)